MKWLCLQKIASIYFIDYKKESFHSSLSINNMKFFKFEKWEQKNIFIDIDWIRRKLNKAKKRDKKFNNWKNGDGMRVAYFIVCFNNKYQNK